jgi:hypothetical protein
MIAVLDGMHQSFQFVKTVWTPPEDIEQQIDFAGRVQF